MYKDIGVQLCINVCVYILVMCWTELLCPLHTIRLCICQCVCGRLEFCRSFLFFFLFNLFRVEVYFVVKLKKKI